MWKFLEQEKELIINELDLLSFLLVTPELFRFVGPAIGAVGYSVMFALLGVLFIGGPASLYIIFHPSPNSPWMLVFLFLFLLFDTDVICLI